MSTSETSRYVRLRVDLVLEVDAPATLTRAAVGRIDGDEFMPEEERVHARAAVADDSAEALAYLVEPYDLVGTVPGVEMVQASWSSEEIEYDPDAMEWDLDDEDGGLGEEATDEAEAEDEAEDRDEDVVQDAGHRG